MTDTASPPPDSNLSPIRTLPRNVWVMAATSFLTDISSEMVLNLTPLFLANVLGVRTDVIGLVEGTAESTASLLKIISGWLSDKLGARKGITVAGYSLSTLAKPFLYLASSWQAVLAIRFADRLGKGIRTAPRDALIADSIDDRHRGLAFGLHRGSDTAGAMVSLLIAAGVVWAMQGPAVDLERATFQRIVTISVVPALLAVICLILGARDVSTGGPARAPRLSLRGMDGRLKRFLAVIVVFTLGNSADAFLVLRAQERGLSLVGVLGMLATFNLVYAALSGPAGAWSDKVGRARLIGGAWLIYGGLYLGFALAVTAWQIWVLYALYGVYYAAADGTARAYIADIVPADQRGTAYGLYNAATGAALLPASLIAGILWQGIGGWGGFGPSAPFIAGSALAILALILLVIWVPRGSSAA